MEELFYEVITAAVRIADGYMERYISESEYPPYKATGQAYISFAKEERELFKLIYMQPRPELEIPEITDQWRRMISLVRENGVSDKEQAELLHLEMWVFVHGIASMIATGSFDFDEELISLMSSNVYRGLSAGLNGGVK